MGNQINIRKMEVRKLQLYNDNTHVTALSAGRKLQSKTLTVGIFEKLE